MNERKWTLLLLGDDPGGIRQITFSSRRLRYVGGALAVVLLGALSVLVYLIAGGAARVRTALLEHENAILTQQLAGFQNRIAELEGTLTRLSSEDGKLRLLAGLDTMNEEILEVGIGGPGLSTPEENKLWPLDSTLGKAAFAVDYDLGALERRARLLAQSLAEVSDTLAVHRDLLESTPSILPAAGVLSSRFSYSRLHPIYHRALPHEGVDISAPAGTPILAAAKGIVTFAGWKDGLGYTVEIDHGYGYMTRYGHASKLLVKRGQKVTRGEVIARVGSTGLSTSPHLHYEVRVGGKAVNPLSYVLRNVLP